MKINSQINWKFTYKLSLHHNKKIIFGSKMHKYNWNWQGNAHTSSSFEWVLNQSLMQKFTSIQKIHKGFTLFWLCIISLQWDEKVFAHHFLDTFILTRWNMVFTSFKKYFLGYMTTRWGMIRLHASVNIKSGSKLYSTPNHENKYAVVIAGFFKSVIHQSAFIHQSSRLHRNFLEVLTYVTC